MAAGGRPHLPVVEVRLVAEAERRVPRLELVRALEVADMAVTIIDAIVAIFIDCSGATMQLVTETIVSAP